MDKSNKYLYIGIFVCVIITLIIVLIFIFRSPTTDKISEKSTNSYIPLADIDDGKGLDTDYIKSEEFKKNLLNKQVDINSVEARGSSFAGPVAAATSKPTPSQVKADKDLTPSELEKKYTYPELLTKFGEDKLKSMFGELKIKEFKDIPNKHSFPKNDFQIKYYSEDNNINLCLDDRETTVPGQYKMNFAKCDAMSNNQKFFYEPYRKYIISTKKNLCLDNGDENVGYTPGVQVGNMSYFSLQNCNPNTHRQRFTYDELGKFLKNADRPEWVLSNPGFNDQTTKNVAVNKEYSDFMSKKQKVIFTNF